MAKKPALTVVGALGTLPQPPRKLGPHGIALWNWVMTEYEISDRGGIETLAQVCAAANRAEELSEQIDQDGPAVLIKGSLKEHPCLKSELANRAFVVRGLQKLGLTVEALKPVGRPVGWAPPPKMSE